MSLRQVALANHVLSVMQHAQAAPNSTTLAQQANLHPDYLQVALEVLVSRQQLATWASEDGQEFYLRATPARQRERNRLTFWQLASVARWGKERPPRPRWRCY